MVAVSRTWAKGHTVQRCNLGQFVFPSILTAFHPCSPIFPPSLLSFLGSLSVYTEYNGALISRNSVWHSMWPAERGRERKRKGKPSRDSIGGPPSEDENGEYARFKTRVARLIRSDQARLGIRSLNNAFWVVDWLTDLGFYCFFFCSLSVSRPFSSLLTKLCMCVWVCKRNSLPSLWVLYMGY